VFIRARATPGGATVVETGGLARSDPGGGFEAEFTRLAAELRSACQTGTATGNPPVTTRAGLPPGN
jgi:hypothetical protein